MLNIAANERTKGGEETYYHTHTHTHTHTHKVMTSRFESGICPDRLILDQATGFTAPVIVRTAAAVFIPPVFFLLFLYFFITFLYWFPAAFFFFFFFFIHFSDTLFFNKCLTFQSLLFNIVYIKGQRCSNIQLTIAILFLSISDRRLMFYLLF